MFKKTTVLAAVVIALLSFNPAYGYFINSPGDPALAGAWVDDMSTWPPGEWVAAIYVGHYSAEAQDNHSRFDSTYAGDYNMTGQYLDNGTYGNKGFSALKLTFYGGASAFGFHWGASDNTWSLTAYDAGNNVIEAHNLPITKSSNAGEFYGLAACNIAYAILANAGGYDWVMIDDLHIATGVVPVPGAVWLLGSGLVGLLGIGRKFSR